MAGNPRARSRHIARSGPKPCARARTGSEDASAPGVPPAHAGVRGRGAADRHRGAPAPGRHAPGPAHGTRPKPLLTHFPPAGCGFASGGVDRRLVRRAAHSTVGRVVPSGTGIHDVLTRGPGSSLHGGPVFHPVAWFPDVPLRGFRLVMPRWGGGLPVRRGNPR